MKLIVTCTQWLRNKAHSYPKTQVIQLTYLHECIGKDGGILISIHEAQIGLDSSLAGCSKHSDGQSIMCPEGLYVKISSVNDLSRSIKETISPIKNDNETSSSEAIDE